NPLANITCDQSFPAQQNLAAFDQCGGPNVTVVPSVDPFVADQCAGYTVTYRWTATDACGNSTSVTQSFSVLPDTQGPVFTTDPSNLTVECDGSGNIGDLNAWLAINGGAIAADACGTVTWSVVAGPTSDACGETGCAVYTFTATDNCGNATTRTALFCIEDTTAPNITTPAANLVVE